MKFKGFCAAMLLSALAAPASADIEVVTSIKPLQLIAAGVMGSLGEPEVLIPPGASPHHYSLKPSERRKLAKADLVVWVGPDLELFLAKALESSKAETLTLLPEDEHAGETAEEHAAHAGKSDHHDEHEGHDDHADHDDHEGHDEHAGHEGHDGHNHGDVDPHLWMDPMQSLQIAEQLVARLSALHPEHKAELEANLAAFSKRLIETDRALMSDLTPLQNKGFFVFHDAYGLFMERYQLKMLGAFTVDPGRPVGTRHLAEIRTQLKADAAVCVFGEPQFKAAVVKAVTEDLPVGYGVLDPLALDVPVSSTGYTDYLLQLGQQVSSCLAGKTVAKS